MKLAQMWRRVVSQALQRREKKVPECNGKQRRQRGAHLFSKDARVTRAPEIEKCNDTSRNRHDVSCACPNTNLLDKVRDSVGL